MKSPLRWLIVACYAVSLPFMRGVWDAIRGGSAPIADTLPLAAGAALVAAIASYLALMKRERRVRAYLSLTAVCLAYGFVFRSLSQPIERVHLAQYGLLSMLVFWALADGGGGPLLCLWAAAITVEFGLADEFAQGIIPARFYDFRDIALNAKSALLGQAVIAFVLRPWEKGAPSARRLAPSRETGARALWLMLVLLIVLTVMNVAIIERGTPTIVEDVHRGDGSLRQRDGFRHFGPAAVAANAAMVAVSLIVVRRFHAAGGGPLRAAILCGLIPSMVLIAGRLIGLRFR